MEHKDDSQLLGGNSSYGTRGGTFIAPAFTSDNNDILNTDEDTISVIPLRSDLESGMDSDVSAGTVAGPRFMGNSDADTDSGLSAKTTGWTDSYAIPDTIAEGNTALAQVKDKVEEAKDAFSAAASSAKTQVGELADQAKTQVSTLTAQATEKVKEQLGDQKSKAAEGLSAITEAIRSSASTLEEKGQAPIAGAVTGFAGQIENFAGYLQDKSVDELAADVTAYARQNPQLFIGGAFLLGIAVARFLKSSNRTTTSDYIPAS